MQFYLLGRNSAEAHPLKRCRQLMEMCREEGEFLSFDAAPDQLSCYARDAQMLHSKLPLLVFRPHTLKGIPPFLKQCHILDIPVTVRCGGTGLSGGCVPASEGVVLLTGHLQKIREYDRNQGTLILEPGVTIRQLNCYAEADDWHFPLSMASEGVAGFAGCLSSQARGGHQQQASLYDAIEWAVLADSQGEVLKVPSPLVCGAEGLWGVVLEAKVQLTRKSHQQKHFKIYGSWNDLLAQLPSLRSLHALAYLIKNKEAAYLGLEGEEWRLPGAASFLQKVFPGIEETGQSPAHVIPFRKPFVVFSSSLRVSDLPEASVFAATETHRLDLDCLYTADVLAGGLKLILQSEEDDYSFSQKVEQFMVYWADFVDHQEGMLGSSYGIGMQMRSFMTPFWGEETRSVWQKLKYAFDPKGIFGREIFFPPAGKSLERQ